MDKIKYRYDDARFIMAALNQIKTELDRVYFNKYQKEMPSPFENTGVSYDNNVFSVHAYDWDDNERPNFIYKDLKVWWYKHVDRGTYAECGHKLTAEDVNQMIIECCTSIKEDINENG